MNPFIIHTGTVAPLDRANVDTDQIIPKQFLKRIERSGFGEFLFYDWRHSPDGKLDSTFVLSQPRFRNASILVTGRNFGCGSSREHAPWALADWGFRAIIAPSFADIFANNCVKNGLLPVVLRESEVETLLGRAQAIGNYQVTIDLRRTAVADTQGFSTQFSIEPFSRQCLLEGLDDIALTLQHENEITKFEQRANQKGQVRG